MNQWRRGRRTIQTRNPRNAEQQTLAFTATAGAFTVPGVPSLGWLVTDLNPERIVSPPEDRITTFPGHAARELSQPCGSNSREAVFCLFSGLIRRTFSLSRFLLQVWAKKPSWAPRPTPALSSSFLSGSERPCLLLRSKGPNVQVATAGVAVATGKSW